MAERSEKYRRAFQEGKDAVLRHPTWAPSNPYDDATEPDEFDGWDDGAFSAGITSLYTNGRYTG